MLLGHIHRPQILNGLHNVFYSGAINAMNFNDEGQERGFWIHEFSDTGKLTKDIIASHHTDGSIRSHGIQKKWKLISERE